MGPDLQTGLFRSFQNTFLDRCSQFSRSISAGKRGMRGGGPGKSVSGLHLGEGRRIPYLMERIPELIFLPRTENLVADFISN